MEIIYPKINFEYLKRIFYIINKSPNQVQIEITNRCNLNCNMCPTNDFKLPLTDMKYEYFKELVEKIKGIEFVLPNGWGEPFIHPDFNKIVDLLKTNGHKIKLTTNGTLINSKKTFDTAMKIDYLAFSLDKTINDQSNIGHNINYNFQDDLIKEIIRRKKINGLKKPYLTLQQVIFKDNTSTNDIIFKAFELGVDRVNVTRPYTFFNKSLAMPWKDRLKIYKSAESAGKKMNIRVDMFEYAFFSNYKRFLYKNFKKIFRFNRRCPRLYDFLFITIDGKVTPCCELPRYVVGDLNYQSINSIWNSYNMKNFRKNHRKICEGCDIYKIGDKY